MIENEWLSRFHDDIEARGWSKWTVGTCRTTVRLLNDFLDEKEVKDMKMDDLVRFKAFLLKRKGNKGRESVSSETIRKHINNVASFLEFLADEDYMDEFPMRRFRQKYMKHETKNAGRGQKRKLLKVDQMQRLISSVLDPNDKAMIVVLAKTGLRAQELMSLNVSDVDMDEWNLRISETGKRSRMDVYIDDETRMVLERWLRHRRHVASRTEKALFLNHDGKRIEHHQLNSRVKRYASMLGYHDEDSKHLEDHYTPHCFRHFFTTHLLRDGMRRDFVQYLRGDSRRETIDTYYQMDLLEVKEQYLKHIPKFNL